MSYWVLAILAVAGGIALGWGVTSTVLGIRGGARIRRRQERKP